MCIRDSGNAKGMHGPMLDALVDALKVTPQIETTLAPSLACLLYTSDAADDLLCVDLGGRRVIKKKTNINLVL